MAGDTSSLTQDDYCLSTTSSLEFIQAIHAFLGRNRIESIGPVRICLESTIRGVPRICVTGEVGRSIFPVDDIAHSSPRSDLDLIDGRLDWSNVTPSPRPITAIKHVPPPALTATETLHSPQEHGFALSPYSELVPSWVQTTPEIGIDFGLSLPEDRAVAQPLGSLQSPYAPTISPDALFPGGYSPEPCLSAYVVQRAEISESSVNAEIPRLNDRVSPSEWLPGIGRTPASDLSSDMLNNSTPSHSVPASSGCSRKRKSTSMSPGDVSNAVVKRLAQNILHEDYQNMLESELPRWIQDGLWNDMSQSVSEVDMLCTPRSLSPSPPSPPSSYSGLERAYNTVCQLNSRMGDDLIRNRIALIRLHMEYTSIHEGHQTSESTVGRGSASQVIDSILENIHHEWCTIDRQHRAKLRAKFHERKKHGKRWLQLANGLGPGILLLSSPKLALAVRGTATTAKMLDSVIELVRATDPGTMDIIEVMNPLAECFIKDESLSTYSVSQILRQLALCLPPELAFRPVTNCTTHTDDTHDHDMSL